MKLLLTSPDAIIDKKTGDFFPGIIEAFDYFLAMDKSNSIVTVSIEKSKLVKIEKKYQPIHINALYRGSPKLIEYLTEKLGCEYSDVLILGCKDYDVFTASNSKTLLLSAEYSQNNNPSSIIFTKSYGLKIKNTKNLIPFFAFYSNIINPWFYELAIDANTTLYALTEANTYGKSQDYSTLCNEFRSCLKNNNQKYLELFAFYFLVSTYKIFKDLEKVNYWGVYPSSSGETNEDLDFFVMKARQSFGIRNKEPIFVRQKAVNKRHKKDKDTRIKEGCDEQFDSIIINPYYKGKLKGKCVCIVDDFTTYGTSCETARYLLTEAGVNKIIFIALGKFSQTYYKYDYNLEGDVFTAYKYKKSGYKELTGKKNSTSNHEFLLSLDNVVH